MSRPGHFHAEWLWIGIHIILDAVVEVTIMIDAPNMLI